MIPVYESLETTLPIASTNYININNKFDSQISLIAINFLCFFSHHVFWKKCNNFV